MCRKRLDLGHPTFMSQWLFWFIEVTGLANIAPWPNFTSQEFLDQVKK